MESNAVDNSDGASGVDIDKVLEDSQKPPEEVIDIDDSESPERKEDDAEDSDEPVKKKAKKLHLHASPVWNFATKLDDLTAQCDVCKNVYKTPQGNTTNVLNHILNQHKDKPEGIELKKLVTQKKEEVAKVRESKDKMKEKNVITNFFPMTQQVSAKKKEEIDGALEEYMIAQSESFNTTEEYYFRKLIYKANNGYVLPSRNTLTRNVDQRVEKIHIDLGKEIQTDIKSHHTIAITSDGGNSGDQNKTKKNTLTVSRIDDNFKMKTDTIGLPEAVGSQTGLVLRTQWKDELKKIGYNENWKVLATTDAAKNERSARQVGRHNEVGLAIKYEADCADHQVHLVVEESKKNLPKLKQTLKRGRKLVNHLSKSTLSRQLVTSIQKELGLPVLTALRGTSNRWFHKKNECERIGQMRPSLEEFQTRRQPGEGARRGGEEEDDDEVETALVVPDKLDDDDFYRMDKYVKAVQPFCTFAKYMSGDKYPTGGRVIPAIDQVKEDLEALKEGEDDEEAKEYVDNLLKNLDKRFKDGWKKKAPYNCLTFLDPSFKDLYCLEEDIFEKLKNDLKFDCVFNEDATNDPLPLPRQQNVPVPEEPLDKRAKLLLKKQQLSGRVASESAVTFESKLDAEISKYKESEPIDIDENPLVWWRTHKTEFPLLAKYYQANGAFQATSVSSERIYNLDKLVYQDRRKNLQVERGSKLVVAQDYLKRRKKPEEYQLCKSCLATQSKTGSPKYRIACEKHNKSSDK